MTYTEKTSDLNPETLGKYDALIIYANTTQITQGPGEGAARLRRGRRRLRPAALRLVLLPELARVRRPGRRPVPEARHRRVRDEGRRPRPPDHQGPRAVPHLGRDLRPHQAQHEGPPRPPDPRRPDRLGALDLDPHAGQGARLLHRLRPRRPHLGPPRLPRPGRARHPLGREQGRRVRLAGRAWRRASSRSSTSRPRSRSTRPGAQWGTLGEPIRKMQKPLAPDESLKHLALPDGFEAKLFVSEPQIGKPITMTWDHRGRLWSRRDGRLPQRAAAEGQGPRPDLDLSRTPTATARPTRSPSSPRT